MAAMISSRRAETGRFSGKVMFRADGKAAWRKGCVRHSRAGGNPGVLVSRAARVPWIPAFAGMTKMHAGMTKMHAGMTKVHAGMAKVHAEEMNAG
ncbi:hypothetical protein GCM10028813_38270 [Ramlibacter alkalitolerans]